jgi:hypothetical protein
MAESGRTSRSSKSGATTPEAYPTTAPQLPSGDYSYILEIVMGMQRTLGKIEQAVDTLTTDSRENIRKVSRLSHIIYAAGVVVLIAVAIFSFTANKLADALIAALKK